MGSVVYGPLRALECRKFVHMGLMQNPLYTGQPSMKSYKPTKVRSCMSSKPERYDEFISSIGSEKNRPEFPYYKIRRGQTIHFYQEQLIQWKAISDSVSGFPSQKRKLSRFENCFEYGVEKGDILILDLVENGDKKISSGESWVFRIKDSDYQEKEILRDLIIEVNDCFATIMQMWGALENNDKKPVHAGMKKLHEAQARLIELSSRL